jgi:acyl-coenzyme A thioesterase PaaI-like protein
MHKFEKIVVKAKTSRLYLWLLNRLLPRMIPFNAGHGYTITHFDDSEVRVRLPLKRRNLNHIRGLHACALATLAEFTTGFRLLTRLGAGKYRIIMERIEMEYFYQGKTDAFAFCRTDEQWVEERVLNPLKHGDSVVVDCEIEVHDANRNHLCTGRVFWQVKEWQKVRLKV